MHGTTQRDTTIIPAIYEAPLCQVLCWMLTYAIDLPEVFTYFMELATLIHIYSFNEISTWHVDSPALSEKYEIGKQRPMWSMHLWRGGGH